VVIINRSGERLMSRLEISVLGGGSLDTIVTILFFLPLACFAAYGVDCLGERYRGYRVTPEAKDALENLWSSSDNAFFRSVFIDPRRKNIQRRMKPLLIEIALKSAAKDIEDSGANSKTYALIEKEAKNIL
jgi:hypothetical protein